MKINHYLASKVETDIFTACEKGEIIIIIGENGFSFDNS